MRISLDHVQVAAPAGCEVAARHFYGALLGLEEIDKPDALQDRGGCWFRCGSQELHIGVETDFRPARKAHPAFAVEYPGDLRQALIDAGYKVIDDDGARFFSSDPWGNRLEFVASRNRPLALPLEPL